MPVLNRKMLALLLSSWLLISNPATIERLWAQEPSAATGQTADQLISLAAQALSNQDYKPATELAVKAASLKLDSFYIQQSAAEILYLSGAPKKSLKPFQRAVDLLPERAPDNWQRGIALATCGEFDAGAKQFETHHKVNPDDVENTAWYFLCVAKSKDLKTARESLIPSRGDPREPMMTILKMYNGKATAEEVTAAADANTLSGPRRELARFYGDLYIGLYYDAADKPKLAKQYLENSLKRKTNGYMFDTARVYLEARFAESAAVAPKKAQGGGRGTKLP